MKETLNAIPDKDGLMLVSPNIRANIWNMPLFIYLLHRPALPACMCSGCDNAAFNIITAQLAFIIISLFEGILLMHLYFAQTTHGLVTNASWPCVGLWSGDLRPEI